MPVNIHLVIFENSNFIGSCILMTVNEAASRWNVNVKTVVEYIVKGYIFDLTIENNRLILPDISKPKIIKGNYLILMFCSLLKKDFS